MTSNDPTYVGQVASVAGGVVRVRLRRDMPTTLVMVDGESYRVGQVGGFFRIPVGYTQLYAVCSQVGADAVPPGSSLQATHPFMTREGDSDLAGYRWMTVVLFGESTGGLFERGVGQYPTVGDEIHFVTTENLKVIYGRSDEHKGLHVGTIASTSGIPANLDLSKFLTRHCAVVGSTGAGKSNLVSVVLESIASPHLPASRALVIDPHGEYAGVSPDRSKVFRVSAGEGDSTLSVPFWALPFSELIAVTFGEMSPANEASVRDMVLCRKREAAKLLENPPPQESITADTPIPFSLRALWFELDDFERSTYRTENNQRVRAHVEHQGNPETLKSNVYELHQPGAKEPFRNPSPRNLGRQLELARSRILDPLYSFLFDPPGGYSPDLNGAVTNDLHTLVSSWVGHDKQLSIVDVSELPSDVAGDVVGLMIRIVYDTLLWASNLAISGKIQPLLLVIDEAHRFIPDGEDGSCHRVVTKVAKEGRKYGVGLMIVTQRPSEVDATVLSQCGTMIALRTTSPQDRARVAAAFPDDLGGLVDLLPSLRTGEGLFVGEAMFVPSRIRIRRSLAASGGTDPDVVAGWCAPDRPSAELYQGAIINWRRQGKE